MVRGLRAQGLVDETRERVVKLLTTDWLVPEPDAGGATGDRRLRELTRIRQIYVPELVLRLHVLLLESRARIPQCVAPPSPLFSPRLTRCPPPSRRGVQERRARARAHDTRRGLAVQAVRGLCAQRAQFGGVPRRGAHRCARGARARRVGPVHGGRRVNPRASVRSRVRECASGRRAVVYLILLVCSWACAAVCCCT